MTDDLQYALENTETALVYLKIALRQLTLLAERRKIKDKRVLKIAFEIGPLLAVVEPALKQLRTEGLYASSTEACTILEIHESDFD